MIHSKSLQAIYHTLLASFCVIVVISNILSAKMVPLPIVDLVIPAGLITYPITFLLSDFVTEVFGAKKAKLMVYIALAMNLLSFALIQLGLMLPSHEPEAQKAFQTVMGLSSLRIFSSLIAYLLSQLVDIQLYTAIKRWTGNRMLWLRNNGSTCIAQLVDTVLIDVIVLWWGMGMHFGDVLPIMLFSYLYKAFFSVACTPLFYFLVLSTRKYENKSKIREHVTTNSINEPIGATL